MALEKRIVTVWPFQRAEARAPVYDTKALFDTAAFPVGGLCMSRIGRAAGSWEGAITESGP